MSLPPLPPALAGYAPTQSAHRELDAIVAKYGQQCRDDLANLVKAVHKAKGRYHSQTAMCDLYDLCGLPNTRPNK